MSAHRLADAQQRAVKQLNLNILDPEILRSHCPLDHGRHIPVPKASLDILTSLPPELHFEILGRVDLQSLLVFRRVNQKAMATRDGMSEFKKVNSYPTLTLAALNRQEILEYTPNTIRMAIGIRTAHTFTIKDLFAKLCQKSCDMGCGRMAPYVDVFKLSSRCLWVGGLCDRSVGPENVLRLNLPIWRWNKMRNSPTHSSEQDTENVTPDDASHFVAIPGCYGHCNMAGYCKIHPSPAEHRVHYDYEEAINVMEDMP